MESESESESSSEEDTWPDNSKIRSKNTMRQFEVLNMPEMDDTDRATLEKRWRMRDIYEAQHQKGDFDKLPRVRGLWKMKAILWTLFHVKQLFDITKRTGAARLKSEWKFFIKNNKVLGEEIHAWLKKSLRQQIWLCLKPEDFAFAPIQSPEKIQKGILKIMEITSALLE